MSNPNKAEQPRTITNQQFFKEKIGRNNFDYQVSPEPFICSTIHFSILVGSTWNSSEILVDQLPNDWFVFSYSLECVWTCKWPNVACIPQGQPFWIDLSPLSTPWRVPGGFSSPVNDLGRSSGHTPLFRVVCQCVRGIPVPSLIVGQPWLMTSHLSPIEMNT